MPERLTIDLHPVFRSDRDIDRMVRNVIIRAARENVGLVEIIHGKGAGKLRARVVGLLRQPGLRKLYRTIDTDTGNAGMLRVRFRCVKGFTSETPRSVFDRLCAHASTILAGCRRNRVLARIEEAINNTFAPVATGLGEFVFGEVTTTPVNT